MVLIAEVRVVEVGGLGLGIRLDFTWADITWLDITWLDVTEMDITEVDITKLELQNSILQSLTLHGVTLQSLISHGLSLQSLILHNFDIAWPILQGLIRHGLYYMAYTTWPEEDQVSSSIIRPVCTFCCTTTV